MTEKSWERMPDEPPRAYEGFCRYRELGLYELGERKRTYENVAQQLDVSLQQISKWGANWNWPVRASDFDDYRRNVQMELVDVGLQEFRQKVTDDLLIEMDVVHKLITTELTEAVKKQAAGGAISPIELVRLVTAVGKLDDLRRRAAGMPTAFKHAESDHQEEDQVFTIGAELGD